jgi:hypothetical protein
MEERVGPRSSPENPWKVMAILAAILLAIGAGAYFFWPSNPPPPPPSAGAPPPPPPPAAPHYAVAASAEPLPRLAESDPAVLDALKKLLGPAAIAKLVMPESLIRNIVATADNLPRDHLAMRMSPVRAALGTFKTTGQDETLVIAATNEARYTPYVEALEATDPAAVVGAYVRLYPLFQQAYVELGFPNGYFNDRLVQVIDHLLDAPDLKTPVKLVSPRVLYLYADPDLEARSAGQKILMRMGAANEARVKAKLRAYRKELEAQTPPK